MPLLEMFWSVIPSKVTSVEARVSIRSVCVGALTPGGYRTSNAPARSGQSLDANTVVGICDGAAPHGHAINDVVFVAADGADGDAVAAGAGVAEEFDVVAGVDGEAVVLVRDVAVLDGDVRGVADVEAVRVVAKTVVVTLGVVDGNVVDDESV